MQQGHDDAVMLGPWQLAIVHASDGADLKRVGGPSSSYDQLAKPVASSHGSVSWNYTVGLSYENAQSTLQVTPGKDRAHIEQGVLPAVQFQVFPRGGVTPPKQAAPAPAEEPGARFHSRVTGILDKLVDREGEIAGGSEPRLKSIPDAAALIDAFPDQSTTKIINTLYLVNWESVDQITQFLDAYAAAKTARGEGRFAKRVLEIRDAVVADYPAAQIRAAARAAREQSDELERQQKQALAEQHDQDTMNMLGTNRGPPGFEDTPVAQFNKLIYPVARPMMIGLVETSDFVVSFVPIIGEAKMLGEAWTGKTLSESYLYMLDHPEAGWDQTPQDLKKWERWLNVGLVALPMVAKLRKLGAGEAGRVIRAIAGSSGGSEKENAKVLESLAALEGKQAELEQAAARLQESGSSTPRARRSRRR